MTSQPGKKTISVHILINISKSKGNRTMKFGQLIGYNMRNIFPEKSCAKCVGETINSAYLWINSRKFYAICFYYYDKLRAIKIY